MQPTIFLVDDEMAILKSVKRSLREMDVDILIFNSPIDALKHRGFKSEVHHLTR